MFHKSLFYFSFNLLLYNLGDSNKIFKSIGKWGDHELQNVPKIQLKNTKIVKKYQKCEKVQKIWQIIVYQKYDQKFCKDHKFQRGP